MSKALGLIEVNGYLAAVEAADSALKAAGVTFIGFEKVKSAITVVKVTGDVGAVRAAVDAGSAAAKALGKLRTSHVIPRLDDQLSSFIESKKVEEKVAIKLPKADEHNETIEVEKEKQKENLSSIIQEKSKDMDEVMEDKLKKKAKEEAVEDFIDELIEAKNKENENSKVLDPIPVIHEPKSEIKAKEIPLEMEESKENLSSMKVEELRRLARILKISMTNKQIKFAKKDELIKAIEENSKAGDK